MTLVCNASNFNVALDSITFFGPNRLKQVCSSPPSTESSFPSGTITRTGQTCILKIMRPSGGLYYCQAQPINKTCFSYTSNQVEVLLTTNSSSGHIYSYFHALEGVLAALVIVLCVLTLVLVFLAVLQCRRKGRASDDSYQQGRLYIKLLYHTHTPTHPPPQASASHQASPCSKISHKQIFLLKVFLPHNYNNYSVFICHRI